MPDSLKLVEQKKSRPDSVNHARSSHARVSRDPSDIDKILESNLSGLDYQVTLTKREREILDSILAGKTNKEIAQQLYRTERTVEYHRNRIMRKFGTHNTVELVKRAITLGLI